MRFVFSKVEEEEDEEEEKKMKNLRKSRLPVFCILCHAIFCTQLLFYMFSTLTSLKVRLN